MEAISYEYTRQRREFGRHPVFSDTKVQTVSVANAAPQDSAAEWVDKKSSTIELDCIPTMSEHWVNTERFVQNSRGMQHTQGAWPKEVKTSEMQDKERFLRRIETQKEFGTAIKKLARVAQRPLEQNNTLDVYEQYFEDSDFDLSSEPPSAKTISVFRDPSGMKRAATKLSWHPDGNAKVGVAYSVMQFQKMPENMPLSSYIWDINHPNQPDFEIVPQSPLCCLVFNPRTPDHIVGGSYNGLIGFWDLRKGSQSIANSVIEKSHHDPVFDIGWIQSRTGNECVSVSTDGQMLWWDVRKLEEGPTDSMLLRGPNENDIVYGATCLEYKSDAGATRYLVGTEQGQLLLVDRKAKKDADSTKSVKTVFGSESGRHHGPVYTAQRHPFGPKYFATVGDWTTRVWMEDLKTPVLTTRYESSYLTSGCWSPTRPGVWFTTKADGTLDVWDFFYKHSDPVFSTKVGESVLSSLSVHRDGQLVAVGSVDGSTTVLQISSALSEQQPNEKQGIAQMLERETKREKNLEIRNNLRKKELSANQKKAKAPTGPGATPAPASGPAAAAAPVAAAAPAPGSAAVEGKALEIKERQEQLLRQAEDDFFRLIDMKAEETPGSRAAAELEHKAEEKSAQRTGAREGRAAEEGGRASRKSLKEEQPASEPEVAPAVKSSASKQSLRHADVEPQGEEQQAVGEDAPQ